MKILGISTFFHDSSACLIEDGKVIAACQEERFTRIKHDCAFPAKSILACLHQADCVPADINCIVFYEKPFLKFERLIETYLAFIPRGLRTFIKVMPLWIKEKLFQKKLLQQELANLGFSKLQLSKILFSSHHLSHAASAFYPSPFEKSVVLTMDGVGEWDTTTVYLGQSNSLKKIKELHFPHSLGLLYSAFTYYCGFKVNSGEYKLMGLAPYGKPRFTEAIKNHLIDLKEDGSFKLNLTYFDYCTGLTMTNKQFNRLFEFSQRAPETELKQVHMDIAVSIQSVLEEVLLKICQSLSQEFQIENLCLAGGVALNCVANGKIQRQNLFKNIWIQPAAGDAGGSLGAALAAYYLHFNKPRIVEALDSMSGAFLGPDYREDQIENFLKSENVNYLKYSDSELYDFITDQLINEKIIGWFQGRMEFGPRALGNRSILADARSKTMQKKINLKIKFRESFRPFAPAVLVERVADWFDFDKSSPYMLTAVKVKKNRLITLESNFLFSGLDLLNQVRSVIPAVTHLDCSARLQTVCYKTNPKFYNLIKCFENKTQTPLLLNTSFNIRGEPPVCSPADAYRCFMGTELDILVLGNCVVLKANHSSTNQVDYKSRYTLD